MIGGTLWLSTDQANINQTAALKRYNDCLDVAAKYRTPSKDCHAEWQAYLEREESSSIDRYMDAALSGIVGKRLTYRRFDVRPA